MPAMLPPQALEVMLAHCQSLSSSEVQPVSLCAGRVLAQDLVALLSHPPRRISAMDGFAVRATDATKGAKLRVVGQSRAGAEIVSAPQDNDNNNDNADADDNDDDNADADDANQNAANQNDANQAVQIFTGAALPDWADAIAIDEICQLEMCKGASNNRVRSITLREAPVRDKYIRAIGADFAQGEILLKKNKHLTPRDVALAATMNHAWLQVWRKPIVSIIASGDELALPGQARGGKQIAAANSLMLAIMVEKLGGQARVIPFAKDSLESLKNAFRQALQGADLLIASGGASKSNADWVGNVIKELGCKQLFSELAMRPGKPTRFAVTQAQGAGESKGEEQGKGKEQGESEGVPILVLPGNPASVFVGAVVFMQPILRKMLNLEKQAEPARYKLKNKVGKGGQRYHYMRALLTDRQKENKQVEVFADQESAHTKTLAHANCLALQPPNAPAKEKGELIEVLEIPGGL